MNRLKLLSIILGTLNILIGSILILFVIMMQNPLSFIMGILYIVFGILALIHKMNKILLFFGIMPLTFLFSFNIIMLGIVKNIPEYFKTPLHIGLLIICPLWLLIFGNLHLYRKLRKNN